MRDEMETTNDFGSWWYCSIGGWGPLFKGSAELPLRPLSEPPKMA